MAQITVCDVCRREITQDYTPTYQERLQVLGYEQFDEKANIELRIGATDSVGKVQEICQPCALEIISNFIAALNSASAND